MNLSNYNDGYVQLMYTDDNNHDFNSRLSQATEKQEHILAEKRNMENRLKVEVDNAKVSHLTLIL